jgi:hypothetical protein
MDETFEVASPKRLVKFLANFDLSMVRKGNFLLAKDSVGNLVCAEPGEIFSASVQDRKSYQVDLYFDELDGWEGFCSCRNHCQCEHVYAVAYTLLAASDAVELGKPGSEPQPSGAIVREPKVPLVSPGTSEPDLHAILSHALGRRLNSAESTFLKKLGRVYRECRQTHSISRWHFNELGLHLPGYSWDALAIWPSFPENIHFFWLYVAQAAQNANLPIPEFMLPVTDLTQIQERMREWKRKLDITVWTNTLQRNNNDPAASSKGGGMDLRLRVTDEKCLLEWKTSTMEEFKALNTSQARRFVDSYEYDSLNFQPAAEVLWQLMRSRIIGGYGPSFTHNDRAGRRILGRLLRNSFLAQQVVNDEGQPFVREDEPLKWSLTPAADLDDDYSLHLLRVDGSAPPPFLAVLDGSPTLYVDGKTIFTGPRPERDVLDPLRENKIPAPALETVAGVEFLKHLDVELPPRLRERVRQLPLQVSITARLKTDTYDGKREFCVLEVTADSEDGMALEKWDGHSWVKIGNNRPVPNPSHDSNAIVFYDRSALQGVPAVLQPLDLTSDRVVGGLAFRATRKFPEIFTDWLRTVPKHIEVRLSGELSSLAGDAVSGRIRLDVQETGIDWFDLHVVVDVSDTELTPEEIKLLLNAKGGYVRLDGKGWKRMEFALTEEEDERLARLGLSPHELSAEPQRLHALQLADESAKKFLPAEQAEHIQRRADEIKARVTPPLPEGLVAELRPYQVEGFHFLAYLSSNHFGGILADDMGLGKTLEALAWLLWLRTLPENAARPVLVVCPKSVMDNWKTEAGRFAPALRVKLWAANELEELSGRTAEADIHVLNYSQLRQLGESLAPIAWAAVILDEGQYIKNPSSQTAQVARALRASHRLVLSGTPIENRLTDLWSLMAFAMPGILGSRHSFGKVFDSKNDPLARRRLAARVRPFLLRRTKSQVAKDLPDKIEEDLFCEIEGEQQSLYNAELKFARQLLLKTKTQKQLDKQRFNFLASLLRLRQICCHPALVNPDSKAESAKINALVEMLEPLLEQGEKVLVFSQFVTLLELLRPVLEKRGWPIYYLTGASENRGKLVNDFQTAEGAAVFLISLKAGGFGLNLTAASYVVLFDPWWNPAVENQAIDRTHRIGQENKVIAYRLLVKGTVEEKIRALQRKKSTLAEDVLGEEKFAQSLTMEDLRFLFEE